MGINLQKGQKIDLTKGGSGLSDILVGLGWDPVEQKSGGLFGLGKKQEDIDCDASVILLGSDGKLHGSSTEQCLVYFGNLVYANGAIQHQGDNLTGEGDGDDEEIVVHLQSIPQDIARLVFTVNIYDANVRKQNFGMIQNAFIRLEDMKNGNEFCRFNLSDNYNGMTGLVAGEIYRYNGEWKFNAIGQPVREASRLQSLLDLYK